jgi:hypothetical protein
MFFAVKIGKRKIGLLAAAVVGFELGKGGRELGIAQGRVYMFVAHELGQLHIRRGRFSRPLAQRLGQGGRDLLQRIVAEVAFSRQVCQHSGQRHFLGFLGQLPDLDGELFGDARSHIIRQLAKTADLVRDRLFPRAPDDPLRDRRDCAEDDRDCRDGSAARAEQ